MPTYVLKANRVENFYVVWSTVVNAPLCWGTRAEVWDYLIENTMHLDEDLWHNPHSRLDRAMNYGSSALIPSMRRPLFGYDDPTLIYEQRGILPRYNLHELCRRLETDNVVADLLGAVRR